MTTETKFATGIFGDIGEYEYRHTRAMNASTLKKGLISARHMRHAIDSPWQPPTDAMRIGSAVHAMVLQPGADVFIPAPVNEKTGKPYGPKSGAFIDVVKQAAVEGKVVLTETERNRIGPIVDSVLGDKWAKQILRDSPAREQVIQWERDGIPCKGKIDAIGHACDLLVELKTTRDIRYHSISKQIQTLGYDISMAWYMSGMEAITGFRPKRFRMIYVESVAPYSVFTFEVGEETLAHGKRRADNLWHMYLDGLDGNWEGPADGQGYAKINVPEWAMKQDDDTIEREDEPDDDQPF